MIRKFLFIFTLIIAATSLANAQEQPKQIPDCGVKPKFEGNDPDCFKPVIFGKDDDGFPKKMKIKGVVTRVTMTHIACGVLCIWGTAEIKLLEKPKGYGYDYLYVLVLCFGGKPEDYIGKIVEQKAVKTEKDRHKWCGDGFYNFLDSQGKPFYDLFDKNNKSTYKLKIIGDYEAQKAEGAYK